MLNHLKWYLCKMLCLMLFASGTSFAASEALRAGIANEPESGKDYVTLKTPIETSMHSPQKMVTVNEFFLFGCSHCYHLNHALTAWKKTLSSEVQVRQVPVVFDSATEAQARLFYSLEQLGLPDRAFSIVFKAIQEENKTLDNQSDIAGYMHEQFGVSSKDFGKAYASDRVTRQVHYTRELIKKVKLVAVPSLLVDGKYLVNPQMAGGLEEMLKTVNFLIKKSFSEKKPD